MPVVSLLNQWQNRLDPGDHVKRNDGFPRRLQRRKTEGDSHVAI